MAIRKTTTITLIAAALVAAATLTTTPPTAAAPMPTDGEGLPFSQADLEVAIKSCDTLTAECKALAAAGENPEETLVTCDYCSEACSNVVMIEEALGRLAEMPKWHNATMACVKLIPWLPDTVGMPEASASDEPVPA